MTLGPEDDLGDKMLQHVADRIERHFEEEWMTGVENCIYSQYFMPKYAPSLLQRRQMIVVQGRNQWHWSRNQQEISIQYNIEQQLGRVRTILTRMLCGLFEEFDSRINCWRNCVALRKGVLHNIFCLVVWPSGLSSGVLTRWPGF